eukprot:3937776-Rhodomonas_salina.1
MDARKREDASRSRWQQAGGRKSPLLVCAKRSGGRTSLSSEAESVQTGHCTTERSGGRGAEDEERRTHDHELGGGERARGVRVEHGELLAQLRAPLCLGQPLPAHAHSTHRHIPDRHTRHTHHRHTIQTDHTQTTRHTRHNTDTAQTHTPPTNTKHTPHTPDTADVRPDPCAIAPDVSTGRRLPSHALPSWGLGWVSLEGRGEGLG